MSIEDRDWYREARKGERARSVVPESPPIERLADRDGRPVAALALQADTRGHYYAYLTINAKPMRLLVDTGATTTTVPRRLANEAGIYQCEYRGKVHTANGTVDRCSARIAALDLGPFHINDVEINISDTDDQALLGANVLRLFSLE